VSRIQLRKCWKMAKRTPDLNLTFLIANYSHMVSNRQLEIGNRNTSCPAPLASQE
jgi:hypothetical protein